ncbi:hypothetical protein PoB_000634700 [Plakobranchus ocellatus]|uniref:Uncharacterized protein n=1 Tax=Plakobranchus ocellatus TaxID=259542 RepID=A0AAV3YBN6_9GAST|nr:hypothetical protein PoB_000634700 [Plakobranchus ocellatus]
MERNSNDLKEKKARGCESGESDAVCKNCGLVPIFNNDLDLYSAAAAVAAARAGCMGEAGRVSSAVRNKKRVSVGDCDGEQHSAMVLSIHTAMPRAMLRRDRKEMPLFYIVIIMFPKFISDAYAWD